MTQPHQCSGADCYVRLSAQLLSAVEARHPSPPPHVIAGAEAVDLLCETYSNPFTTAATGHMVRALASDPDMAAMVIGTLVEIAVQADRKLDQGHRLFHAQSPEVQATIEASAQVRPE